MSEDKHSRDKVPAIGLWRKMRDVELHLDTEKLDADFSHGARWLFRLTGSARWIKFDSQHRHS